MINQCNRFGMDSIEMGNVLSMCMEATDKGYLNGNGLAWGDADAMAAHDRAHRLPQGRRGLEAGRGRLPAAPSSLATPISP